MKNIRGFTLLELLLYMAVLAALMLTISVLFSTLLQAKMKMRVMREVDEQGALALIQLSAWVRDADSVGAPATGEQSSELFLTQTYPTSVSREITPVNGQLGVVIDGGDWTPLTNTQVVVDSFTVTEVSSGSSTPAIRIDLSLEGAPTSSRNEYVYARQFTTTASIR